MGRRITCHCGNCSTCKTRYAVRKYRGREIIETRPAYDPSEFPNFDLEMASLQKYASGRRTGPLKEDGRG